MKRADTRRQPAVSLFVGSGLILGVVPEPVLALLVSQPWEIHLTRWLGVVLVLFGWMSKSMRRRRLPPDRLLRFYEIFGPVTGLAGLLSQHRVFLLVGFCVLTAGVCRGAALIGTDIQLTTLRRLER
jgi:hypothetical protein